MKKSFLILLLLILSCLFWACDNGDSPDDPVGPVGPVEPVEPVEPIEPIEPVLTRPDLGNDGINQGKAYGWNAGNLGELTATITGNVTSAQYLYAQGLDAGWNAGNSLDVPNGETEWGNPALNQALFNGLKARGFRVVRIPVTWYTKVGSAPDYQIDTAYLDRVAEVAGYAHAAGLVAIINSHHDNYWLFLNSALTDPDTYTGRITALWSQIAEKFKDYGEWLIFEPLNEPRGQVGSTTYWDSAPDDAMYDILNQWNQAFVDTVRESGGNNAHRYLLVKGYAAKPHLVNYITLPTDTSPNKLIADFHYYDPQGFSLDGSTTVWTVAGNGKKIRYDFEDIHDAFVKKGLPVTVGECGVTYQGARTGTDATTANTSRRAYLEHMGRTAREFGLTPILWDNGQYDQQVRNDDNYGLINRETGAANSDISQAAIDAFIEGIRTDK
jgi:aryl-phospho-beta-D-glucosidase BglC (GH1 family)